MTCTRRKCLAVGTAPRMAECASDVRQPEDPVVPSLGSVHRSSSRSMRRDYESGARPIAGRSGTVRPGTGYKRWVRSLAGRFLLRAPRCRSHGFPVPASCRGTGAGEPVQGDVVQLLREADSATGLGSGVREGDELLTEPRRESGRGVEQGVTERLRSPCPESSRSRSRP